MAPAPTPQMPGNLTVPVLFGWENLVTVVVLAVVTAVLFVVALAAAAAGSRRSEWRGWLDSRPTGAARPAPDAAERDRSVRRGAPVALATGLRCSAPGGPQELGEVRQGGRDLGEAGAQR
ncbi:hypothetical protein [Blastococcus capsensis]|uniref:hypothetical protein n=1 Tax=Blastococcus capsensis TaxID=1564163 RepID=UPI002540EF6E|nr:hypothetical protein [Blastococcus capsensis]MDK3256929.1 hypothetical protein [Blastococcus capsensis]